QKPDDEQRGCAVKEWLVWLAKYFKRMLPQMSLEVLRNKSFEQVRDAIRRNRIHSNNHQREGPAFHTRHIDDKIKTGGKQEAPSATVKHPARRPNPFPYRANAEPAEHCAREQAHNSRHNEPAHFAHSRSFAAKNAACDQPQNHCSECWNETQRRISAAIKS